jgi:hypothetical protein
VGCVSEFQFSVASSAVFTSSPASASAVVTARAVLEAPPPLPFLLPAVARW